MEEEDSEKNSVFVICNVESDELDRHMDQELKIMLIWLLKSHHDHQPDRYTFKIRTRVEKYFNLDISKIPEELVKGYNES